MHGAQFVGRKPDDLTGLCIDLQDTYRTVVAANKEPPNLSTPWFAVVARPIYDIKGPESIDSYAFRAQGKWQPVQAVTALVGFDYTRERGTGWLGANFQGALTQEDEGPDATIDDDNIPNPIPPFVACWAMMSSRWIATSHAIEKAPIKAFSLPK